MLLPFIPLVPETATAGDIRARARMGAGAVEATPTSIIEHADGTRMRVTPRSRRVPAHAHRHQLRHSRRKRARQHHPPEVMTTHPGASDHRHMAIFDSPSTGHGEESWALPLSRTVDHVLACYIKWREDAAAVRDAYGRWSTATPEADKTGLFSAYLAALDQEQSSAGSYALGIARLEASLPPSETACGNANQTSETTQGHRRRHTVHDDPTQGTHNGGLSDEDPTEGRAVAGDDPTQARRVGASPGGDPTEGSGVRGLPGEDPTQGSGAGVDPFEDPTA